MSEALSQWDCYKLISYYADEVRDCANKYDACLHTVL